MTAIKYFLATLGVIAFGGAMQSQVQPAEAKVKLSEIQRACERALQANSIEAIEAFLRKYPPGKYRNDIACYALALDAVDSFSDRQDHDARGGNGGGGGNGYNQ